MAPASFIFSAFILYLYLPHIFFKFWAENSIDLGRRRDASQLEEFISAALPSAILNLFALLTSAATWPFFGTAPRLDWVFIKTTVYLTKDQTPPFEGINWFATFSYLFTLYFVSALLGWMFGRAVLRLAALPEYQDGGTPRPSSSSVLPKDEGLSDGEALEANTEERGAAFQWKALPLSVVYFLFRPLYHEMFVTLFPWTVVHPYVYVRTKDMRVYHGRFLRYEKNPDGAMEAIRLDEVRRYCWDEKQARYEKGELPISKFYGTLYMKWDEIADINRVEDDAIEELIDECRRDLAAYEGRAADDTPAE